MGRMLQLAACAVFAVGLLAAADTDGAVRAISAALRAGHFQQALDQAVAPRRDSPRSPHPGPAGDGAERTAETERRAGGIQASDKPRARLGAGDRGSSGNRIPGGQTRSCRPPGTPAGAPARRADRARHAGRARMEAFRLPCRRESLQPGRGGGWLATRCPQGIRRLPAKAETAG
jgi:hypothetical protein